MHDEDVRTHPAVDPFTVNRALLVGVAYRVLGSVSDAEDVVQDAWLRWSRVEPDKVDDPRAFLVTIATRLAIDRLRRRKSRKESRAGTWLPEPMVTASDPAERAQLAESLSMGLLLVLETLSPLERAVFVLREAFGYEFADIAEVVGRQEPAVRQLAHRARRHVAQRRPRYAVDTATQRRVTERFLAATADGDIEALVDVLSPQVVLIADGGGKVRAPLLPVVGAERVIRFLMAAAGRSVDGQQAGIVELNGSPGIVVTVDGEPVAALSIEIWADHVTAIHLVGDPDKLHSLAAARRPS